MWNNWFLGCPKPTTRTYYKLHEIAQLMYPDQVWSNWAIDQCGVYQFIDNDDTFWGTRDTDHTRTLFTDYIWPQFWNSVIFYLDDAEDLTNPEIVIEWNKKLGLIYRWINESKEVYEVLISNLEANKNKLLNAIKTSTSTKFNDTPQEPGVFTEDEYTSSITATESATDAGTLMSRLKEIEDDLRSLYGKWANEFSRFIIYSAI